MFHVHPFLTEFFFKLDQAGTFQWFLAKKVLVEPYFSEIIVKIRFVKDQNSFCDSLGFTFKSMLFLKFLEKRVTIQNRSLEWTHVGTNHTFG